MSSSYRSGQIAMRCRSRMAPRQRKRWRAVATRSITSCASPRKMARLCRSRASLSQRHERRRLGGLAFQFTHVAGVELSIEAAARQQVIMPSLLDNLATVEDQDQVGVLDGRQAVGDDQ